jgi:heptaprenyl diphosphate synthase
MDTHIEETLKKTIKPANRATTHTHAQRIALCGILIAGAMVLSYIESLIPLPLPVPGIKLGVANTMSLLALYNLGWRSALSINIMRIVLAGAMFTGFSAMLYGLAGGILSVLVMTLVKRVGIFSTIGVSVAGASAHILGQLTLASVVIQSAAIYVTAPPLMLSAVVSGVLIGYVVQLILRYLPMI